MLKPSERINLVLSGKVDLKSEDKSIQSACSKFIYDGAIAILAMKDKEARKRALKRVPEMIRPHIEEEVWRIYKRRNQK